LLNDRAGFSSVPIAVGETGWPTQGGSGASTTNGCIYNNGLISRLRQGKGTPRVKQGIAVFIFEAQDELLKPTGSGAMQGESEVAQRQKDSIDTPPRQAGCL